MEDCSEMLNNSSLTGKNTAIVAVLFFLHYWNYICFITRSGWNNPAILGWYLKRYPGDFAGV